MINYFNNIYFHRLPRIKQISGSHCGPAVIEMLLGNLGYRIDQDDVVRAANSSTKKINRFGLNIKEMATATHNLVSDIQFWFKENTEISDIEEILFQHKYPVGIEWQGDFGIYDDEDLGHYSVVTHIDEYKNIYIADPYEYFAGKDRKFSFETFEELWWDINEIYNYKTGKLEKVKDNRLIFIIVPKNVVFPKDIGMVRG